VTISFSKTILHHEVSKAVSYLQARNSILKLCAEVDLEQCGIYELQVVYSLLLFK